MKEMCRDDSCDVIAEALQSDIFEWHFVFRGPPDTEFEGGVYHGRILLPSEYPFKPPSFMMLTPSGRFEVMTKICLSISSHHPEHWQPSWSIRTALTALIAFMPSPGAGAVGSLDFPKEERAKMATKARAVPPTFGSAERQALIAEMHARMLARIDSERSGPSAANSCSGSAPAGLAEAPTDGGGDAAAEAPAAAAPTAAEEAPSSSSQQPARAPRTPTATPAPAVAMQAAAPTHHQGATAPTDTGLTLLAVALAVAIGAIVLRKVLAALGGEGAL
ncbi:hypothetical protein FOA52_015591 [Chlamydomonas sp. UWO 241]|nr:hypothetical protein FOA52_015591 [Chlamydomonas sp. UWO 241]